MDRLSKASADGVRERSGHPTGRTRKPGPNQESARREPQFLVRAESARVGCDPNSYAQHGDATQAQNSCRSSPKQRLCEPLTSDQRPQRMPFPGVRVGRFANIGKLFHDVNPSPDLPPQHHEPISQADFSQVTMRSVICMVPTATKYWTSRFERTDNLQGSSPSWTTRSDFQDA